MSFRHQQPRTDRNIWPSLTSTDPLALRAWLAQLGFAEGVLIQDGDIVQHSEMFWPEGGRVMVSSYRSTDTNTLPAGVGDIYIVTERPGEVHQRAIEAGHKIIRELGDTDYGSRDFSVRSPDGHRLNFGTYAGS